MSERFDEIEACPKDVSEESDVKTEISNSRKRIRSTTEDLPISEHGSFTLNGERFGTIHALSSRLGIPYSRIYKEIRKNEIMPVKGKTRSGLIGRYYPEQIFRDSYPEAKNPPIVNGHEAETDSEKQILDEKPNEESDVKTGIGNSRNEIESVVEDLPCPENGFFMLDRERYGTIKAWSGRLDIPEYRIVKKIREEKIKSTNRLRRKPGKTNPGEIEKYYPEHIFIDFLLEKAKQSRSVPIANEQGYFIRDGKMSGTIDFWVQHFYLDKTTFEAQVKNMKIPNMEGKTHDLKMESFYSDHDIRQAVLCWNDSQKKLLSDLHAGHELPRLRVKKRSMQNPALRGDIVLIIPKEHTGIYQWLQNELHFAPPRPGQVFVLFEKREGLSVVSEKELEEI